MNRYLIAVAVALFTVIGLYRYGFHKGWSERDAEMQVVIAQKNEESRQKEQVMAEQLTTNATKLQEANHAITEKQSALDRAIRAGRVRLPTPSCIQAPAGAPTAAGDRDEAPSESERETLAAIAAVVAQGDRNTEQLNACIDAYNQVREQLNGSNH
jgi:hypothetical protein